MFLNFEGGIDNLKLVVNKYQIQSCGNANVGQIKLNWINEGNKQPYGLIWVANEEYQSPGKDNVIYYIEIRTDGEGHPPQLKIGGALKNEKFLNTFIYKATEKNKMDKPIIASASGNLLENLLNMLLA